MNKYIYIYIYTQCVYIYIYIYIHVYSYDMTTYDMVRCPAVLRYMPWCRLAWYDTIRYNNI